MTVSRTCRSWIGAALLCGLLTGCSVKKSQDAGSKQDSTSWSNLRWVEVPGHSGRDSLPLSILKAAQPRIPPLVKTILDSAYPGWAYMSHEDITNSASPNQRTERLEFFSCDLNGDSLADYAMAIIAGRDTDRTEWFLAFVSDGNSYRMFPLSGFKSPIIGGSELEVQRKGVGIPDFSRWKGSFDPGSDIDSITVRFKTDALTLMPGQGCCPTTFIFEDGRFREFDSGD